jgi:hypothetical protein
MAKLVVFGDSWPAGGELADRNNAFPFLLADQLGLELEQFSSDGSSQPYDVYKFIRWLEMPAADRKNCIVLFCFTGKDRSWFFKNGLIQEIHPAVNSPATDAYYRHIYSSELSNAETLKNILLIQSLAVSQNVTLRMIMNWDDIPTSCLIDRNSMYHTTLAGMLGGVVTSESGLTPFFKTSKYIVPNISHPNPQGHQYIADELAIWLKPTVHCLM